MSLLLSKALLMFTGLTERATERESPLRGAGGHGHTESQTLEAVQLNLWETGLPLCPKWNFHPPAAGPGEQTDPLGCLSV